MSTPVGACGARCEAPATARLLVDVRERVPGLKLLAAPPWSDPELRFLVHPEVATRLQQAVAVLPDDLRLGFWEGLRPLPVQQRLWDVSLEYLHAEYPRLTLEELETTVELFVARPGADIPPHSTGSAVDVAAVNAFGQVLSPSDAWGRLGVEVVSRALHGTGLANYTPEWWHWSYGDAEWARAYDCAPLAFATTPEFDGPGGGI
jgi:D-alanyl-D-alanine dipeptidase